MQYSPYLWPNRRNFRVIFRNRGRGTRWWCQILDRKRKYSRFAHAQWKICNITLLYGRIAIFASFRKSGSRNTMLTSDFSPEVEIRPFRAYAMHPTIIIGTVRLLWTWLWGRYHVRSTERISSYYWKSFCSLLILGDEFNKPERQRKTGQNRWTPYIEI